MNLATAQRYVAQIVPWLAPYCERIEVAGSVRRGLANCNDIDLVCIPKAEIEKDMFGTVTGEKNLLWEFLASYVALGKASFQSGGNVPGKFAILQLSKCQLDVYFAEETTFATRMLCRTGSKEHNIWLADRCHDQGKEWKPYEGVLQDGKITRFKTEAEIYAFMGLKYIEPRDREELWLKQLRDRN